MAEEANKAIKNALAEYASERDEPAAMVKEIMRVQAPLDATVLWWIRKWVELSEKYPRPVSNV